MLGLQQGATSVLGHGSVQEFTASMAAYVSCVAGETIYMQLQRGLWQTVQVTPDSLRPRKRCEESNSEFTAG